MVVLFDSVLPRRRGSRKSASAKAALPDDTPTSRLEGMLASIPVRRASQASLAAFWRALIGDSGPRGDKTRARQMEAFLKRRPTAAISHLVNSSLVAIIFWDSALAGFLLFWLAACWLTALNLTWSWWRDRRDGRPKAVEPRALVWPCLLSGFRGLLWGSAGGMAALAAVLMAPLPIASLSFVVLAMAPLIAGFVAWGGDLAFTMAAMLTLYTLALCHLAKLSHDVLVDGVRSNIDREFLIDELGEAHEQISQAYGQLQKELTDARQMQEALLPPPGYISEVERRYGLKIMSHFEPSSTLGGDYWGMSGLADGILGLCMVDFSGHGVHAAMNVFRLHALLSRSRPDTLDTALFLEQLNSDLCKLLPTGQFATVLCGTLDVNTDTFSYACAAPTRPLIYLPETGEVMAGTNKGLPAGIKVDAGYVETRVPFPPGAVMFLYSDALIEAQGPDGLCMDGNQLLAKVTDHLKSASPETLTKTIVDDLHRAVPGLLADDLTVVTIWRLPQRSGAPTPSDLCVDEILDLMKA